MNPPKSGEVLSNTPRRELPAVILCGPCWPSPPSTESDAARVANYTPPTPPPLACGSLDCAIVGAGIGGMSAASALIAAGKNVVVLEARNRVGGRAFSDNSFATPVDLGAEWFHFVTRLSLLPSGMGNFTLSPTECR